MDLTLILNALIASRDYVVLAIAILGMVNGSARGSIAAVSETMQAGLILTNDQALQKASDIMGKWTPFLPEFVRKWLIQMAFDSMKKVAIQEKKIIPATNK